MPVFGGPADVSANCNFTSGMRSTQDGDIVFCIFVLSSVGYLSGTLYLNKLDKALSRLEDMAFVNEQKQTLRSPALGW